MTLKIILTCFTISSLLICACQPRISKMTSSLAPVTYLEDSTVTNHRFLKGSGLGGTSLVFIENGTFSMISFCDICPEMSLTYGYYLEHEKSVELIDTLWYNEDLHGAKSFDFKDTRKKYHTHVMDKVYVNGKLILSEHLLLLEKGFVYRKNDL